MLFNGGLEKKKVVTSEYYWILHKHLGGLWKTAKTVRHGNCSLNRHSDPGPTKYVTDVLSTVPRSPLGKYRKSAPTPSSYV
jgi:hypothetical protein